MLFTRCPECDTTFRLTDETLKKANGQVRCGRCASVFNAYAELHDPAVKSFAPDLAERSGTAPEPAPPPPAPTPESPPAGVTAVGPPPEGAGEARLAGAPRAPDTAAAEPTPNHAAVPDIGTATAAAAVADAESAADAAARETADDAPSDNAHAISATEIERVLTAGAEPVPQTAYAWEPAPPTKRRTGERRWAVGAVLALVVLGAQAVHHFRSDIAAHSTFGPWLTAAYDAVGATLVPAYDVRQYEILDWVATAEPNARGLGSLKITARIQNRGPLRQPFPSVQLRLKDRWEEAVGSRVFTPAEYLPRDTPRGRLMAPGETARAEIEVVDPGPDAYGFELDVCIEVEASLVTCGTDEIFL